MHFNLNSDIMNYKHLSFSVESIDNGLARCVSWVPETLDMAFNFNVELSAVVWFSSFFLFISWGVLNSIRKT